MRRRARAGTGAPAPSYTLAPAAAPAPTTAPQTAAAAAPAPAQAQANGNAAAQSVQLSCLFTNQRTRKRKTWTDGGLTVSLNNGKTVLSGFDPRTKVDNRMLASKHLSRADLTQLLTGAMESFEMGQFIIEVQLDSAAPPPPPAGTAAGAAAAVGAATPAAGGGSIGPAQPPATKKVKKAFKKFRPPAPRKTMHGASSSTLVPLRTQRPGQQAQPQQPRRLGETLLSGSGSGSGSGGGHGGAAGDSMQHRQYRFTTEELDAIWADGGGGLLAGSSTAAASVSAPAPAPTPAPAPGERERGTRGQHATPGASTASPTPPPARRAVTFAEQDYELSGNSSKGIGGTDTTHSPEPQSQPPPQHPVRRGHAHAADDPEQSTEPETDHQPEEEEEKEEEEEGGYEGSPPKRSAEDLLRLLARANE